MAINLEARPDKYKSKNMRDIKISHKKIYAGSNTRLGLDVMDIIKIFDTSSNKVLFVLSCLDHTLVNITDFIVTKFF